MYVTNDSVLNILHRHTKNINKNKYFEYAYTTCIDLSLFFKRQKMHIKELHSASYNALQFR